MANVGRILAVKLLEHGKLPASNDYWFSILFVSRFVLPILVVPVSDDHSIALLNVGI